MIRFADETSTPAVKQMWKTCFGDTDEFIDLYFSYKYEDQNTLIYFEKGRAVASLQMLPYFITFYGQKIPFYYMAGLCTLPECRGRGYMPQLIEKSHQLAVERDIPLAILVPAEEWLFGYYNKFGYEQVFKGNAKTFNLDKLLSTSSDLETAYSNFDILFNRHDFCVQKDFYDFSVIVNELRLDGFPPHFNLSGMASVIQVETLLALYASSNKEKEFELIVEDDGETIRFHISKGEVFSDFSKIEGLDSLMVDKRTLCRLLFGFKVKELGNEMFSSLFPEHEPIINFMLE